MRPTISVRQDLYAPVAKKETDNRDLEMGEDGDSTQSRWKRVVDYASMKKLWQECQLTQDDGSHQVDCMGSDVKQEPEEMEVIDITDEVEVVLESAMAMKCEPDVLAGKKGHTPKNSGSSG